MHDRASEERRSSHERPLRSTARRRLRRRCGLRRQADSFEPSTLTISKGETVEFENESGDDKWPASNVHPTHELYPGFDAQEPVLDGDSYEFTFDRPGRWGYHDHLKPDIQGTIVVED
jgi:plastocyanin